MNVPTEVEIAWAAGLFEGEGCIQLPKVRREHGYDSPLRLCIQSTDEDVINKICNLIPFSRREGPHKPSGHGIKMTYRFVIQGRHALEFSNQISPHLCSRRSERLQEALKEYERLRRK